PLDRAADVFLLESIGRFREADSFGEIFEHIALRTEDEGQVLGADLVARGQECHPLHQVSKLADIAWPAVQLEPFRGIWADCQLLAIRLSTEPLEEKLRQRQDILRP